MSYFLIIFLLWVFGYILIYFFQEKFIFNPGMIKISDEIANELKQYSLTFKVDNINVRGWFRKGKGKNLLIYYGGNGENITPHFKKFLSLTDLSILFLNYRGYFNSDGVPSEKNFFNDALTILDIFSKEYNYQKEDILLMGRSIGTAVACFVASHRPIRALILSTPIDSIVSISQQLVPIYPMKLILKHKFDNIKISLKVSMPTLVLLAGVDKKVPLKNSLKLISSLPNIVNVVNVENYTHRTIKDSPLYWQEIYNFVNNMI